MFQSFKHIDFDNGKTLQICNNHYKKIIDYLSQETLENMTFKDAFYFIIKLLYQKLINKKPTKIICNCTVIYKFMYCGIDCKNDKFVLTKNVPLNYNYMISYNRFKNLDKFMIDKLKFLYKQFIVVENVPHSQLLEDCNHRCVIFYGTNEESSQYYFDNNFSNKCLNRNYDDDQYFKRLKQPFYKIL